MFSIGDKVTYYTEYGIEQGIVKSVSTDNNYFVVFKCGGDWNNYKDYTGVRTNSRDLTLGWLEENNG